MLRKSLTASILLGLTTIALAQTSGTPSEQKACAPDVRKFCHKVKPADGDSAYLQCLELNRDNLSKACLAVLIDHGR